MTRQLQGRSPTEAVAYREMLRLASTGQTIELGVAIEVVQRARDELGLDRYRGGRASDLVQRATKGYRLNEGADSDALFRKDGRSLVPVAREWRRDWRLLFAPRHGAVRSLAAEGLVLGPDAARVARRACDGTSRFIPPDPVLPEVDLVVGRGDEVRGALLAYERRRQPDSRLPRSIPGIYFHRRGATIYVGKTGEVVTRHRGHAREGEVDWMVFVARCADEGPMGGDVLGAAEALLIQLLAEIAHLNNKDGGRDTAPGSLRELREAAAFAMVAAASLVRLHRDREVNVPLHRAVGAGFLAEELARPAPRPA